jgi:O-antigen/teichoic acid export membrane protein
VFKFSIYLNSLVTIIILILNFVFKIYLAREFSQENLVIYYTITDIISLILRVFIGNKDALITIYNQTEYKLEIIRTFTVFYLLIILIVALLILPLVTNFYLVEKIEAFQLSWWYISILFISMNIVSYYSYIFLVTKSYKLISMIVFLKGLSLIGVILFLYIVVEMEANYTTLIVAAILSNFIVLVYLIYIQSRFLPEFNLYKLIGNRLLNFKDNTNIQFIKSTIISSSNYFIYGLLLFAPVFIMLNHGTTNELANYQVVARSIYFGLISVFSWPLGRFMFPEVSSLIARKEYFTLKNIQAKFVKLLILFGVVVVPSCWVLSEIVIKSIFPIEYVESYRMINILIVSLPFVMYQNFSESVIKAHDKYIILFLIKSIGVIIFIISYFIIVNVYGFQHPSIYSFIFGLLGIFFISLYFERRLLNCK